MEPKTWKRLGVINELIKRPHPAIVHFPISLFPISFVFLILFWTQFNFFYLSAGFWCYLFGSVMSIPSALTGFWDMKRLQAGSDEGYRTLNLHMILGVAIFLLSVGGSIYFLIDYPQRLPMSHSAQIAPFTLIVAILTLFVLIQGYLGALMVYRHHFGIEGETRKSG